MDSLVEIVNLENNVIGSKKKGKVTHKVYFMVSASLIESPERKIFLVKKKINKKN